MNGTDREKYIRSDSEFKGFVLAKLEDIEREIKSHKTEEMETLNKIEIRLSKIENWKVKVSATAGIVGAIAGFLVNKFF